MIILSQDGTILLFQNHVRDICIYNNAVYARPDYGMICIGEYKNEDRTKEILAQIATAIQREQRVFYMPEE